MDIYFGLVLVLDFLVRFIMRLGLRLMFDPQNSDRERADVCSV